MVDTGAGLKDVGDRGLAGSVIFGNEIDVAGGSTYTARPKKNLSIIKKCHSKKAVNGVFLQFCLFALNFSET